MATVRPRRLERIKPMDQLPIWLAAAVDAAGMATAYNADDWDRIVDNTASRSVSLAAPESTGTPH